MGKKSKKAKNIVEIEEDDVEDAEEDLTSANKKRKIPSRAGRVPAKRAKVKKSTNKKQKEKVEDEVDDVESEKSKTKPSSNGSLKHAIGIAEKLGSRHPIMEDMYVSLYGDTLKESLKDLKMAVNMRGYFAIYDGHGGSRCAKFVSNNLHTCIFKKLQNVTTKEDIIARIAEAFVEYDNEFIDMAAECNWIDGSCALVCIIVENNLYVVNLGDSDAAYYGKNISTLLTQHHHPTVKEEIEFIENAGGLVETYWGQQRVTCLEAKHALAVTRAFGDLEFKRPKKILNSCPTTTTYELTGKENFLVMASDGLWDAKSVNSVGKIFHGG